LMRRFMSAISMLRAVEHSIQIRSKQRKVFAQIIGASSNKITICKCKH
jgi:hypothetical protein